ncbi:MAG: MFS transporter [Anaerolineae bacterium]|nr:MFS transporter [Anaerolineae bacterium]
MALTSFFTDVSSEMIINVLPLFLANVLGVKTNVIGLIEGVAETTASLLKSVSGWLSDKLRQRKSLAVLGYALSAFSKPFLYFATSWAGVLFVRFADRVGKGVRTSPRDALIADSVDEHQRGRAFGLHRAGDTAGAVLGLLIALLVVLATQSQSLALSRETFQLLVLISIVPAFLAVIILAMGVKEVPIKIKTGQAVRLSFNALDSRFRSFLLIIIVFTLGSSADAFLVLRAQDLGLSVVGVLAMLMTFNIIYAALARPLGILSDRIGRTQLLIVGWLIYAGVYLGFALAGAVWQVWVLYGIYGLYYAFTEGAAKALIADFVPSEQRGTAYGYYNAAIGLMALPASVLAGVLWQGIGGWAGFGASAPFIVGAVFAIIAVILLILWDRQQKASA